MGAAFGIIAAILYGGIFFIVGLFYWASAELPLILCEIAYNTRKEGDNNKKRYDGVSMLSKLLKIFAVLLWIIGGIAVIALLAGGGAMLMRGF